MSTTACFSWVTDFCTRNFFKSNDLSKTSLNKKTRPSKLKTSSPKTEPCHPTEELIRDRKSSLQNPKRDLDTPIKLEKVPSVTEKDFRILRILRSGKDWRIYMVKKGNEDQLYAMKLIARTRMVKNCIEDKVAMEKQILEKAKHPFIPKLSWHFENEKKIFIVMEFVEGGGTLQHVLHKLSRFSEEITRFYSAEIILTLEYLQKELQVSYGELKLRHFLMDSQGHIKLIDFSQAKKLPPPKDPQGSPGLKGVDLHCMDRMNDFLGLGVLIYQLLTGRKPHSTGNEDENEAEVLSPTSQISWPSFVSKPAKDLITRLLHPNETERLGYNGFDEIKKHAFFAETNWDKMLSKSVYPPLVPSEFVSKVEVNEDDDDGLDEGGVSCRQSMERILETSSLTNSSEDIDAISFDRTTGISSRLNNY